MKNLILTIFVICLCQFSQAQTLPGKFHSSWIGNTFGGKNSSTGSANAADPADKWVQDYIDCMTVTEDGTCFTTSDWDEAHREYGIYKNGDVLGNKNQILNCGIAGVFSISGTTIVGNGKTITNVEKPTAIAMGRGIYDGKLLVSDNGKRKQILIYDVSGTPVIVETLGVEGGITADFTPTYDFPAAINAPVYPAKNYPPGYYHPLKLWGITGVGCDALGRIFVSTSELGSAIRCFKKVDNNWILDWRVENYFFVDQIGYDEKTDAVDIYGVQEHIRLDFSKNTPGQEWSIVGYTLDSYNYPEDPRGIADIKAGHEHGLTSIESREINGTRYLWSQGMTCQPPVILKFKPNTDIAVPCGMFFPRDHRIYDLPITYWWPPQRPSTNQGGTMYWSDLNNDGKYQSNEYSMLKNNFDGGDFYIDKSGNLWQGRNPIKVWKPTFAANGNIVYSDNNIEEIAIEGVTSIGKLKFQEEYDRLVILTTACRNINGGKMYIIDNWSAGNRTARYVADLKGPNQSAWTVAGDYAFEAGYETKATVWVTDLNNGKLIGKMIPDASCGGVERTGWVDISSGIKAYKRKSTGEHLVFVEDDYLSRVILYRWCPTGDCTESDMKVKLTAPENGRLYINNFPLTLKAEVTKDTSEISKVEFFINDTLIGQSISAPYQTNWENPYLGYSKATASATSTKGVKVFSASSIFRMSDGSPEVLLNLSRRIYSVMDSVVIKPVIKTIDNAIIDSVVFYMGDSVLFTDKSPDYSFTWKNLPSGTWNIKIKAIDMAGKIGWSETIPIVVSAWGVVDNNDLGWTWSGYDFDACGTCYNGSAHSTNIKGSYALFTFTGTDLEAYCETFGDGGDVEIFIDGVSKGSFSQSVAPYGGAKIFAKITGLTNTVHAAKFVSSSASWTGIDYIRIAVNPAGTTQISAIQKYDLVQIYPNPLFGGELTIKTALKGNKNVRITDITGKTVYSNTFAGSELKINKLSLNSGLYIIIIHNNNEILNVKLVVK